MVSCLSSCQCRTRTEPQALQSKRCTRSEMYADWFLIRMTRRWATRMDSMWTMPWLPQVGFPSTIAFSDLTTTTSSKLANLSLTKKQWIPQNSPYWVVSTYKGTLMTTHTGKIGDIRDSCQGETITTLIVNSSTSTKTCESTSLLPSLVLKARPSNMHAQGWTLLSDSTVSVWTSTEKSLRSETLSTSNSSDQSSSSGLSWYSCRRTHFPWKKSRWRAWWQSSLRHSAGRWWPRWMRLRDTDSLPRSRTTSSARSLRACRVTKSRLCKVLCRQQTQPKRSISKTKTFSNSTTRPRVRSMSSNTRSKTTWSSQEREWSKEKLIPLQSASRWMARDNKS